MQTPINRDSPFWQSLFAIAYAETLRRHPSGDQVLPGPRLAMIARGMADDCERARLDAEAENCAACGGVGCETCLYTGKAHPTGPIVAPPPMGEGGRVLAFVRPEGSATEPAPSPFAEVLDAIRAAGAEPALPLFGDESSTPKG
ncbi:MAG: hypothetical protein ACRDNM_00050 [Gaiellaceae bacterium]